MIDYWLLLTNNDNNPDWNGKKTIIFHEIDGVDINSYIKKMGTWLSKLIIINYLS